MCGLLIVSVEQKRLMDAYGAELCSVMKTRWDCEVTLTPPLLNIPVLPCNFIPIDAQLYTGQQLSQGAVAHLH